MGIISFKKLESLLTANGKTFYSLRKDKIVGTETIKKLQHGGGIIDTRTISNLCEYLDCQPGDIMEYLTSQPFIDEESERLNQRTENQTEIPFNLNTLDSQHLIDEKMSQPTENR